MRFGGNNRQSTKEESMLSNRSAQEDAVKPDVPGPWGVAFKNGGFLFRLSASPGG